jgi:hypothetical protein
LEAQNAWTTLNEFRNPAVIDKFDFTDEFTGQVKEFFDNGMTKENKLSQINDIILRLKEHIEREKEYEDADHA